MQTTKPLKLQTTKPFIVACIPAFNEEMRIAKVVVLAKRYASKVIVCDDGSSDMTAEIAESLGAEVLRHRQNMGYGAALGSLFHKAVAEKADIMVTIDGDGQHNASDIPRMIKPILNGEADVVIGSRFLEGSKTNAPGYRKIGIGVITKLANAGSYNDVTDSQSGFRAYNLMVADAVKPSEMGMGASTEILMKAREKHLRIKEIPINITYSDDSSTHNPVYHGLDVVLSTVKHLSIRHPLMMYGAPGFALLLVAAFFLMWALDIFSVTRQLVTNLTLIAVGSAVIGILLLTTGVILWVMITVVKER